MPVIHRVVLSNDTVLLIEEGNHCLHIGSETEGLEKDFDAYICEINANGVLVLPNSGQAGEYLTNKLSANAS